MIVVHKGNPLDIRSVRRFEARWLAHRHRQRAQVRYGRVDGRDAAAGGGAPGVKKNVVVESATGDILINQMLAAPSKLDAVIAYVSNVKPAADRLEAVAIDLPCAVATQPIAIGRETKFKQLAERLRAALLSPVSRRHSRRPALSGRPRQDEGMTRGRSDVPFLAALAVLGGLYVLLIVGMLLADASFTTPAHLWQALSQPRDSLRHQAEPDLLHHHCHPVGVGGGAAGLFAVALLLPRQDAARRAARHPHCAAATGHWAEFADPVPDAARPRVETVLPVTYAIPGVILCSSRWPPPLPCGR